MPNKHKTTAQDQLLARAVEFAPVPVMISGLQGNIEYCNAAFTELTGYTEKELIGQNPRILASGKTPRQTYERMWATILKGESWHGELCNRRKNGRLYWELISIKAIKDPDGKITHFVAMWQDITRRRHTESSLAEKSRKLERLSITDELTGIYNRRYVLSSLEKEVERVLRYGQHLSGMLVDIDNFKAINDQCGHIIGDAVIKTFANVLAKSIRNIDILGRYGGDEFLIVLPEATLEVARRVGRRVQENLLVYQQNVGENLPPLTASIGLISFEGIGRSADIKLFIEKMDHALRLAKGSGKNQITVI